jgi:hypothetical protein
MKLRNLRFLSAAGVVLSASLWSAPSAFAQG